VLFAAGAAYAEPAGSTEPDAVPGSAVLPGVGLSPQAPPVPPAPGGRAPSFGAPAEKTPATFKIGGRIYGYESFGIGRAPSNPPAGYSGTPLHIPAVFAGKLPYWGGAGLTLNLSYGTPSLSVYATYYLQPSGKEYQGYYAPISGPGFGVAYLQLTPDPIGILHLKFKAGSVLEVYGGPGQWGWGIFGPMLAVHGFGETSTADWDVTRDLHLTLIQGFVVVPGVAEDFPRGDYNGWLETGVSNWVHHAHVGLDFRNQYHLKLHYASAHGADERLRNLNALNTNNHGDGRMDVYAVETGWDDQPWGHVGLTGALYDFTNGASVSDGIWWTTEWSQGAITMVNKYLGPYSNGNGKVAVVGAEYNFSVSSLLWYPRSFTANAPDIRVSIAAMLTRTLSTPDPYFKNATGYFFGVETEYRMTAQFSLTFKSYGESRDANVLAPIIGSDGIPTYIPVHQRASIYSCNPGIAFHANWTSLDRIELIYSRRFYSNAVDNNSAQPLDHHTIVLGGYITF
jgi:hypothetical protein